MIGIEPEVEFLRVCTAPTVKAGLDLDYAIEEHDGKVYLLFPGSNSIIDWVNNFSFPAHVYKHQDTIMLVHGGYAKIWNSAHKDIVFDLILKCEALNVTPYIIGHSLGGAMALLAAEDYYHWTGKKARVLTFGAPKLCANKRTTRYIGSTCFVNQYAQRNDIVTKLPWGYRHVNLVPIGEKQSLKKLFDPKVYHMAYGDKNLYTKENT